VDLSSDGASALIGAPARNNNTGAAYIFQGSWSSWPQVQELTASDGVSWDGFGGPVVLNGDGSVALIAAPERNNGSGAVNVF
jgi:hypothetical protein